MRRFVAVCTLKRGILEQPELLADADQYVANVREMTDLGIDMEVLQSRATRHYRLERDPELTALDAARMIGWPNGNSQAAKMLKLSKGA